MELAALLLLSRTLASPMDAAPSFHYVEENMPEGNNTSRRHDGTHHNPRLFTLLLAVATKLENSFVLHTELHTSTVKRSPISSKGRV